MTLERARNQSLLFAFAALAALAVAPPPAAAEELRPFRPSETLPGETVRPAKSGARFTAPRGWRHGWAEDGASYYLLPGAQRSGAQVVISRTLLSRADRSASVTQLLTRTAAELLEGTPARPVIGPEAFTVGGQRAGRVIARASAVGGELEGYLGGVIAGDWAFLIVAVYPAASADEIRPGVDTVLASFRGEGPAPNRALARRLQGCWEKYDGSSGGVGSGSSTTRYNFAPDGRYSYRFYMSMSAGGASAYRDNREAGTFAVFGDQLTLQSDEGETETHTLRAARGGLHIGGARYIPCG